MNWLHVPNLTLLYLDPCLFMPTVRSSRQQRRLKKWREVWIISSNSWLEMSPGMCLGRCIQSCQCICISRTCFELACQFVWCQCIQHLCCVWFSCILFNHFSVSNTCVVCLLLCLVQCQCITSNHIMCSEHPWRIATNHAWCFDQY